MSEKKKPNWIKIRNEYETTNISYRKLAEKYDVSFHTLQARAKRESWVKNKDETYDKITTKLRQKTVEKISDRNSKHIELWDKILTRVEKVIDEELNKSMTMFGDVIESEVTSLDKLEKVSKVLEKIQAGHRKAENVIDAPTLKKLELDREKFEHDKQSNTDKVINVISNIPRPPATGGDEQ